MERLEYDLSTGELKTIQLTQNEINAIAANQSPAPIRTIDARRLRLALLQLNLLDSVEAAIPTLGRAAQIEWEFATDIKEDYPLVISLSTKLGLNVSKIFDVAIEII
jgi:hypothetical protein